MWSLNRYWVSAFQWVGLVLLQKSFRLAAVIIYRVEGLESLYWSLFIWKLKAACHLLFRFRIR